MYPDTIPFFSLTLLLVLFWGLPVWAFPCYIYCLLFLCQCDGTLCMCVCIQHEALKNVGYECGFSSCLVFLLIPPLCCPLPPFLSTKLTKFPPLILMFEVFLSPFLHFQVLYFILNHTFNSNQLYLYQACYNQRSQLWKSLRPGRLLHVSVWVFSWYFGFLP